MAAKPSWRLTVEKWQHQDRDRYDHWSRICETLKSEGLRPRAAEWLAFEETREEGEG